MAVHMKTHKWHFQITVESAFEFMLFIERFHCLRVDGRPKCIKKFAFTTFCVYNLFVWTGPQCILSVAVLLSAIADVFFVLDSFFEVFIASTVVVCCTVP